MNNEKFNAILEEQLEKARKTLAGKAGEYASDTDRLHNFRKAANLQEMTNAEALGGMLAKHIISVFDMIDKGDTTLFSQEQWDEKIGDAINYFILLQAVIQDDRDEAGKAAEKDYLEQTILEIKDGVYIRKDAQEQVSSQLKRPIGDSNIENDAAYYAEPQNIPVLSGNLATRAIDLAEEDLKERNRNRATAGKPPIARDSNTFKIMVGEHYSILTEQNPRIKSSSDVTAENQGEHLPSTPDEIAAAYTEHRRLRAEANQVPLTLKAFKQYFTV